MARRFGTEQTFYCNQLMSAFRGKVDMALRLYALSKQGPLLALSRHPICIAGGKRTSLRHAAMSANKADKHRNNASLV